MGPLARASETRFTWDDYRTWSDDERWELIDGEAFAMSPSPGSKHQNISGQLFAGLAAYFKGKPCRPFIAPLDVKLSEEDIVQPDLLVVCDPAQIKRTHIEGAPSLVVEILSPSTESHDRGRKLELYAKSGVAECWLVSPFPPYVEVLSLDGPSYRVWRVFQQDETLRGKLFPDLELKLPEVFDFPLEPEELELLHPKPLKRA